MTRPARPLPPCAPGLAGRLAIVLARLGVMALIAASLIAPGVMPARNTGGVLQLEICTGHGPVSMTLPSPDDPAPDHRDDSAVAAICGFAAAQVAVVLAGQTLPRAPLRAARARRARPASRRPVARRPLRPFAARAPPILS
ncbi:DUF2946 family protein [Paracoccus sp. p4-l81]|uniref:DUF2946 family protein n=1 Tax=Paracoccus sp. p4-l81 TaxID=3342806 RepID=UPI0035B9A1FB